MKQKLTMHSQLINFERTYLNEKGPVHNQTLEACKVMAAIDNVYLLVHKSGPHHPVL